MNTPVGDELGRAATREWETLVTTAVLGTDRRALPAAAPGWDLGRAAGDPAVELLDRAAAVATARRAGRRPAPAPPLIEPAPRDPRAPCPAAAAALLGSILAGTHEVLLPEWFALCRSAGFQLPAFLLPTLLARGRRQPALDIAVREIAGERARWLAEAMPELRLAAESPQLPAGMQPLLPPAPPADSTAVIAAVVDAFAERAATWAAAAQLRVVVASVAPASLAHLVRQLEHVSFHPSTERTRVELLGLAHARIEMLASMSPPRATGAVPFPGG